MLHLSSASEAGPLAATLAEVLAEPLADPMTSEWVAVPTVGMHRWLALELARSLGASDPHAGDGVAANITFTFPDALRQAVLGAGKADGTTDPWQVEHLVWAVLDVLHTGNATTAWARSRSCPPEPPGLAGPGASPTSSTGTPCAGPTWWRSGTPGGTSTAPVGHSPTTTAGSPTCGA